MNSLAVRLGPLALENPITTASGTFGYGLEFTDFVDLSTIGALCTKGLSLKPHAGNAPPRICETPAGMLNAIGLQNVGIEVFLTEKLPRLRALGATVIANVWGDLEEDYVTVVRALEGAEGVAAIELNISCPNVQRGGMLFGNSPPATRSLVAKVRAATRRPLIVKLSPNAPDLVESARAAREAGADILSLVNTFVGMAIDPETAKPRISFGTGGLSGPAIKPLAVRMVYQVARALPDTPHHGNRRDRGARRRARVPGGGRDRGPDRDRQLQGSRRLGTSRARARRVLRRKEDERLRPDRPRAAGRTGGRRGGSRGMRDDRICIALDFPTRARILSMAQLLAGRVGWLKVGLEAFVAEGPSLVAEVAKTGSRVFLDLKFHDIPATVAGAVAAAARSGADMVNVHAFGGRAMLEAAREAADRAKPPRLRLIAVTLLTSLDAKSLADLPMAGHPEGIARRLATLAKDCGLDGVVCAATDLAGIRDACGPDFFTVVPGIRPAGRTCRTRSARRHPRLRSETARACSSSAGP